MARPECAWIGRDLEQGAQAYAIAEVVPVHLEEVRAQRLDLIAKTEAAVKDRLTKEINYWDHRAETLKLQEAAGKANARLNSNEARKRADNLEARLQKRMEELQLEAKLSPLPPVILGGVLVVPIGLLAKISPPTRPAPLATTDTQASAAVPARSSWTSSAGSASSRWIARPRSWAMTSKAGCPAPASCGSWK
jgi:hypothetical protein